MLRRSLLLGLCTLALAGCASRPDISRLADPDADFHAYRSFTVLTPEGDLSLVERRLRAAARSQLERRGYAQDDEAPDLLVNIAAVVEDRPHLRPAPGHVPDVDGLEMVDLRQGRLVIELIDTRRRQVVWHGSAEGRVSQAMLRDAGAAAEQAVAAVFAGFPVPAAASASPWAPTAP